MAYESVDHLQKILAQKVFHYAKDSKKAAGRALGTLVEIITFYLLKSWGFEHSVTIERPLPEYGNPEITHNVEFSLHPILRQHSLTLPPSSLPITTTRIFSRLQAEGQFSLLGFEKSGLTLLTRDHILRNACLLAQGSHSHLITTLSSTPPTELNLAILELLSKPYAMFECKRVGVEEGMKKGPQTIEKAKQGAYVAKSISALHKIRSTSGELQGLIYTAHHLPYTKPYAELLAEIIASHAADLLRDFVLTVGVVSNHGNWFTSDNHNKELKVLAQAYDWLIFLTDEGLSDFITEFLLHPTPIVKPVKDAFIASYTQGKKKNRFTKVQMAYAADQVLQDYFHHQRQRIAQWFNIITPHPGSLHKLQTQLAHLRDKDWKGLHGL